MQDSDSRLEPAVAVLRVWSFIHSCLSFQSISFVALSTFFVIRVSCFDSDPQNLSDRGIALGYVGFAIIFMSHEHMKAKACKVLSLVYK